MQRAAIRVLRRLGTLSREEAGAISHANRGKHGVDDRCMWCATDGALLLESLIRRGLAEPSVGGDVRLPTPKPPALLQDDEIPY